MGRARAAEAWPSWWRAVERVEVIEPGNSDGIGARTALPYRIAFNMRRLRVEKLALIEGRAAGVAWNHNVVMDWGREAGRALSRPISPQRARASP